MTAFTAQLRGSPRLYRFLDRLRWQFGHESPARLTVGGKTVTLACNRYSHIEREVKSGHFERTRLEWVAERLPRFDLFVDLGANVGLYSLVAARHGLRALAFEPEERNFARLNENVARNGLADRVRTEAVAVGRESGEAILHRSLTDNRGTVTLGSTGEAGCDEVPTRIATLDSYGLGATDGRVMFKCDIEGAELDMLAGAEQTLARLTDALWLIEVHRCYGVEPAAVEAVLRAAGYERYRWADEEGTAWSDDAPPPTGNVLLVAARGECAALV